MSRNRRKIAQFKKEDRIVDTQSKRLGIQNTLDERLRDDQCETVIRVKWFKYSQNQPEDIILFVVDCDTL